MMASPRINGLLSLLFLCLLFDYNHAQQINRNQQQVFAEIAAQTAPHFVNRAAPRRLQLSAAVNNFTEACSLCSGFPVKSDLIAREIYTLQGVPPNATCGDLNAIFSTLPVDFSEDSDCLAAQALFAGACCDFPAEPYVCEQNVRLALFEMYDASVMPLTASRVLPVELFVELLHISDLNTKAGTVTVFVWLSLTWNDPRLAWEINGANCTTSITARASMDMDQTEIYVPEIDLLNQVSGVQNFPNAMATVYNDGTVVWRRNGGLQAFCFFTGLNRFPFDTLGCSYLVGWVGEHQVDIILGGDNNAGWTTGQSLERVIYNEYTLVAEQTQSGYYYGLKSIVYYNLYFERSSRYYILKVLLPTIVFTLLSFGVFFLDLRVGERLTYGLTVLLVIIAQDITTSSLLPITNQGVWINFFVVGSFYWVLITNLESVFVAWLYYLGDNDNDHTRSLHSNKRKRGDSTNGEVNQDEAGPREENVGVASGVAVESSAKENDEEEQTEAYGGLTGTQQDTEPCKQKAVSFSRDANDDGSDERDDAQKSNRRVLFQRVTSAGALSSRRFLTFQQLLSQKNQPMTKRHQTIKKIDTWCFWILGSTYILFVILMFVTNSLWNDNNELYVEGDEIPE